MQRKRKRKNAYTVNNTRIATSKQRIKRNANDAVSAADVRTNQQR